MKISLGMVSNEEHTRKSVHQIKMQIHFEKMTSTHQATGNLSRTSHRCLPERHRDVHFNHNIDKPCSYAKNGEQ